MVRGVMAVVLIDGHLHVLGLFRHAQIGPSENLFCSWEAKSSRTSPAKNEARGEARRACMEVGFRVRVPSYALLPGFRLSGAMSESDRLYAAGLVSVGNDEARNLANGDH
ncbi:hypothetical protein AN958_11632 [Leucoagaricus sp. SymC.cos]|nr:hypothetical protein AN958_11632 [Leucoagaricus sp. SymC.cos]